MHRLSRAPSGNSLGKGFSHPVEDYKSNIEYGTNGMLEVRKVCKQFSWQERSKVFDLILFICDVWQCFTYYLCI